MRRLQTFVVAVQALFATSCSSFDEQAKASAESAVRAQLLDPNSAMFEGEFIRFGKTLGLAGREMFTCGLVNAKNGFGGMAGRKRFVVDQSVSKIQGKMSFSTGTAIIEKGEPGQIVRDEDTMLFEELHWKPDCLGGAQP